MSHHKVLVDVITPTWQYCNLQNPYHRGKKTDGYCRFCKEIKQRGQDPRYFCMLFDNELETKGGAVEKTCLCYKHWKRNEIIDLTGEPAEARVSNDIAPKEVGKVVKDSMKKVKKLASDFIKAGIPVETAYEVASKQIADEWK